MAKSTQLRLTDYRALLALVGELGELAATASPMSAVEHLLDRVGERFAAATSLIRLDYPQGTSHAFRPPPWRVGGQVVKGLDEWQERFWREWFIERNGQFEHPLFLASIRQAGQRRAHARSELVPDKIWYASDFVNNCLRQVDFDHSIASVIPLSGYSEVVLAAARNWSDEPLSARELRWLEMLSQHIEWLLRMCSSQLAASQAAAKTVQPRLSPRLQETLELLLGGCSEAQIAEAMNLTPRSAHKYVERVYRAFDVHTRAELMALWTTSIDAAEVRPDRLNSRPRV